MRALLSLSLAHLRSLWANLARLCQPSGWALGWQLVALSPSWSPSAFHVARRVGAAAQRIGKKRHLVVFEPGDSQLVLIAPVGPAAQQTRGLWLQSDAPCDHLHAPWQMRDLAIVQPSR